MPASATVHSAPFRAARGLTWLAGFGAFGVSLSALYATTGVGLPCPFRMITGWNCPLCGGTRLGSALLHGDVVSAFGYNPVVFTGLAVLSVLGLLWTVEALGGPRLRPTGAITARLGAVTPTTWVLAGGLLAVVYILLRNLL